MFACGRIKKGGRARREKKVKEGLGNIPVASGGVNEVVDRVGEGRQPVPLAVLLRLGRVPLVLATGVRDLEDKLDPGLEFVLVRSGGLVMVYIRYLDGTRFNLLRRSMRYSLR